MADLIDIIKGSLSDDVIGQLGRQTGISDKKKTSAAAEGAIGILLNAIQKNNGDPNASSAFGNALDKDHDGSILDDVMGYISGTSNLSPRTTNGEGILGHLLGNKQKQATEMLGKKAGLSKQSAGSLLAMLAPIVLGALGKQKSSGGLDAGGLLDMLTGSIQNKQSGGNAMDSLLDIFLQGQSGGQRSGKGQLLNMGMKILGSFFKKR